jgi:hypothetical protein
MGSRASTVGLAGPGMRTRMRDWTRRHARLPVARIAAGIVALCWIAIVIAVLERWLAPAPAPFYAAAALTAAMVLALFYDVVVEWVDPDERESLPRRLQPELAWAPVERLVRLLQIGAVPACFGIGLLVGHWGWH